MLPVLHLQLVQVVPQLECTSPVPIHAKIVSMSARPVHREFSVLVVGHPIIDNSPQIDALLNQDSMMMEPMP